MEYEKDVEKIAKKISKILKDNADPYQSVEINDHEIKITSVRNYYPTDVEKN